MPRPKSKPKPRVLLTFTGFRDPYSLGSVEGGDRREETRVNQDLRRKLDRITDTLWAGGVTNPVT